MLTASSLSTINGSSVIFTPDQKNILVCSSNFQLQQNQMTPIMGEITADQILDMPIVFADEPPQEEMKHTTDDSSYFIANNSDPQIIVKEEPIEVENQDVYPTKTAIPERLKIKQVYLNKQFL